MAIGLSTRPGVSPRRSDTRVLRSAQVNSSLEGPLGPRWWSMAPLVPSTRCLGHKRPGERASDTSVGLEGADEDPLVRGGVAKSHDSAPRR